VKTKSIICTKKSKHKFRSRLKTKKIKKKINFIIDDSLMLYDLGPFKSTLKKPKHNFLSS